VRRSCRIWRWTLLVLIVAAGCGDCGRCGTGTDAGAQELGKKRIGPCWYEYTGPVAWWRAGFVWVEVNGLPVDTVDVDPEQKTVRFPCEPYLRTGAGEPTDVLLLWVHT